ncbi:glycosyl transferase family 2 [Mesobacillus campisalis]|uniref:Glycosyl transferase family 2 n=2 Tax=Mesobacillus campisalis TaxID=1408103 RepID=A0A0M2SVH6_9BACI|nr:glycosyl transferase family 2 [Mesobacillus campisalis]
MGIYNCEKTLAESIQSIQNQTYPEWELIMCDDGSIDRTMEVAQGFVNEDARIKLIKNGQNVGLAKTLNHCLEYCTGDFIMRHDGDDIMLDQRMEKQVNYMGAHDCDACGTGVYLFDQDGVWGTRQLVENPTKETMIMGAPFIHPTVIMKRQKLIEAGGYSDNEATRQRLEDYDLWLKFYEKGYVLRNIQEPLLYFREDKNSYQRKSRRFRLTETKTRLGACRRLNIPYSKRIFALKPLLIMLVPKSSLRKFHIWNSNQASLPAELTKFNKGQR